MKSKLFSLILLLTFMATAGIQAQAPLADAKFAFSYHFQSGDGTNACGITYIPGANVYVTAIAGNTSFPMEVFDREGNTLASLEVGKDIRGLWYNPKTSQLEANCYGSDGWYGLKINGQGIPDGEWTPIISGMFQPEEQSALSYVSSKGLLVTVGNNYFSTWKRSSKKPKEKPRYFHGTPGDTDWYINPYVAAYTGNDAYPLAVLELNACQILYFDLKGKYLGATKVDNCPEMDGFRFGFANRHAFIYDEVDRNWKAYRVF
ncbi:MAG: hypothetical protein U0176_19105 [Bacteroidia bacterium]